jgi:cytochrome c oxidase subunit 4
MTVMTQGVSEPVHPIGLRVYVFTYVGLLALATLSFLLAGLPSSIGLVVALTIAAIKAVLVMMYFMHLREERFSVHFVMIVAVLLVGVFVGLTALDPATRGPYPPAPEQNESFVHEGTTGG